MSIMLRTQPNASVPGLLVPQVQEVPFNKYVGGKTNIGSLAVEQAYITMINSINGDANVGQQWGDDLNRQSYAMGQVSAPFYKISAFVEYNVDEQAKFEALSNGVALPEFLENIAKQTINQKRHQAILFGFDGGAGANQGILANATIKTLPADSASKTKITEYNIAELASFLGGVARDVATATFGSAKPVVITSSTRTINYIRSAIVSLTESQKEGAGVDTIGGVVSRIVDWLGVGKVEFIANDLLKDDTNGDTIAFIAPGIDKQVKVNDEDSQNLAGKFNSITYNTWYDGAEGLLRFDALPNRGVMGAEYVYKMTPAVTLRKEAVVKIVAKYA